MSTNKYDWKHIQQKDTLIQMATCLELTEESEDEIF